MPTSVVSQLLPRGIADFPAGSNTSDTLINGLHYNVTALRHFNYTLYTNNTISNISKCYLAFDNYKPVFLSNGTWLNATTCYVPISGIELRGKLGIAFATLFAACLLLVLVNLKKHGTQYLREDRRFRLVGRRWQWYWCLFVCACGLVGTMTSIDVDRDYLPDMAIILQGFFFYLMYPATMAAAWEVVRHWGSWQERQSIDREPFADRKSDRRAKLELFMPLVFYLFAWLNFFLTIPRSWTPIKFQRSPEQQAAVAMPAATDLRFKAGSIVMFAAYATIVYSFKHTLHYYCPPSPTNGFLQTWRKCPTKLILVLAVIAVRIAYGIASAWLWDISVLKYDMELGWAYGAGYAPSLLVLLILIIAGLMEENEDKQLIAQRRARGRATDAELGITRKPAWWRANRAATFLSDEERLRDLAGAEINGSRTSAQRRSREKYSLSPVEDLAVSSTAVPVAELIVKSRSRSRSHEVEEVIMPKLGSERRGTATTDATTSSGETLIGGAILHASQNNNRSMLDV